MNTKHISLAFAVLTAVALFVGCTKTPINGHKSNLELSNVSANETKAVIDGTIFPKDGHIGLFLFKDESAINLSNSGISVQTVSIEDWNVVEVGGHKFTWSMSAGTTRILPAYPRNANDLKRLLYLLLSENLYFDGLASISSCTSKVFPQDIRGRFVEKRHFSPPVTLPSTTRTVGVSADSLG